MRFVAFLLPAFLLYSLFACKRPVDRVIVPTWNEKDNPTITKVSLVDTLQGGAWRSINIQEIKGVSVRYSTGERTFYFEYTADTDKLLTLLNCRPFKKSNQVSDTTCRLLPFDFSLSGKNIIPVEEIASSDFFWNIQPKDFFYYECLKSPERHTVLIHRKTGRILHRVET